ncbi:MAG TPA: HD domain-containing protein [Candidatus Nitrosocosmicus sp.]|nr:HD domain-containing protein [Candidatus Nitrosocosmicus sp.]
MARANTSKQENLSNIIEYFYRLKELPRTGWKQKLDIANAESVASHTLLMIVLVFFFSEKYGYSCKKIIKLVEMTLIHDLAESIIGDITPETMNKNTKSKLENEAFNVIIQKINSKSLKNRYSELWHEYQSEKSFESKCIHLLDKLEMVLQANYYFVNRKAIRKDDVAPFFQSGLRYASKRSNSRLAKISNKNIQDTNELEDIKEILEYFSR